MIEINKDIVKVFLTMFENAGRPLKLPEIQEYLKKAGVNLLPSDVKKVLHLLERYRVISISSPMTGFVSKDGYETYIYTPHHYVEFLKRRLIEKLPEALSRVEFVLKCNNCGTYHFDYTITSCPVCGSQNLSFVDKNEILEIVNRISFDDFHQLVSLEIEGGLTKVVEYLLSNS